MKIACWLNVFLILAGFRISRADDPQYASAYYDAKTDEVYIEGDYLEGAVAWARFSNQVNETGYVCLAIVGCR